MQVFSYQRSDTLFISDGTRKFSCVGDLNIVDLQPLLLAVDLQVDALVQLHLLAVLEPLGDGVTLAQFNLQGGFLLAGGHGQRLDLLRELGWKLCANN